MYKIQDLVYRTVEFKDMARKQYEKYYFRNNRLCGAILIGDAVSYTHLHAGGGLFGDALYPLSEIPPV